VQPRISTQSQIKPCTKSSNCSIFSWWTFKILMSRYVYFFMTALYFAWAYWWQSYCR
jgi:hypothetical protein